jgi:hypothetical protein
VFFFGVSSAVGGYSSYRNGGCYFGCLLIGLINVVLFQYAVLFYDEQRWFFYGQQACATVQDASFLMFFYAVVVEIPFQNDIFSISFLRCSPNTIFSYAFISLHLHSACLGLHSRALSFVGITNKFHPI